MNTVVKGDITGDIFRFDETLKKLEREIQRLLSAQYEVREVDALDAAMNAAHTALNLLEWEAIDKHERTEKLGQRALLLEKDNEDLNLLFDIVTFSKHAKVSNSAYDGEPINVRTSAGNTHLYGVDEDDNEIWKRARITKVKFEDKTAEFVLGKGKRCYEAVRRCLPVYPSPKGIPSRYH